MLTDTNTEVKNSNLIDGSGSRDDPRKVYIMELEFVQSLSNPDYLHWLSKQGYFDQQEFRNFLKYLRYWKFPEYASALLFPQCLRILDAVQDPSFCSSLSSRDTIIELKRQQSHQWIYFDWTHDDVLKEILYRTFINQPEV